MHALSTGELLMVWEWGLARGLLERGLVLLAAACPNEPVEQLLHLSIGERDARLAGLRELTFGSRLDCQVKCPVCTQQLELDIATDDLFASSSLDAIAGDGSAEITHDQWRVRFRLVETRDLLAALDAGDSVAARRFLLRRCVVGSTPPRGAEVAGLPEDGLPTGVEATLFAEMERLDVASNITLALNCPECRHAWSAPFDILSFFWREIEAWAVRTLRQVHWLASAYGWSEHEVLALSAWRRDAYLQLAGHA
jgi:hypothetical protein